MTQVARLLMLTTCLAAPAFAETSGVEKDQLALGFIKLTDMAPLAIANSMTGTFEFEKGDTRPAPDFNVFFRYNATFPYYSDAVWYLTQMRRWGQISEAHPDAWYDAAAKSVYKPAIYEEAARALIAEGQAAEADFDFDADGYKPATTDFIDGVSYDGLQPNAYIDGFAIGLKANQTVADGAVGN